MQQPLVSVIVPAYNHAGYLRQRIHSILSQTHSNIEVILLDDASTDGSASILNEYAGDARVKAIVYNETNNGSPIQQWLKGLALATAGWIWIAESDDEAMPEFLSAFADAVQAAPNISLFACASVQVAATTGEEELLALPYPSGKVDGKTFFLSQMLIRNALYLNRSTWG